MRCARTVAIGLGRLGLGGSCARAIFKRLSSLDFAHILLDGAGNLTLRLFLCRKIISTKEVGKIRKLRRALARPLLELGRAKQMIISRSAHVCRDRQVEGRGKVGQLES